MIICLIFGSELVKIEGALLLLSQVSGATRTTTALDTRWSLQRRDGTAGRRGLPAYSWKTRRLKNGRPPCPDARREAAKLGGPGKREDDRMCSSKGSKGELMHTLPGKCSPAAEHLVWEDKVSEIQAQLK